MKKIIISFLVFLICFCFIAADNCRAIDININLPENIEDINDIKNLLSNDNLEDQISQNVQNELDENGIPIWKQVFAWLKEFIWPKIEKIVDEVMTPEREEELEKEKEEFKNDLPNFFEQLKSFIDEVKNPEEE